MATISLALREVKDLKNKIAECDSRIRSSVLWNEEEPPVREFATLIEQRDNLVTRLTELKARIAEANAGHDVTWDGHNISLAQAIITLTELKGEIGLYNGLRTQREERRVETSTSWEPDEHDYSKRVKVTNTTVTCCAFVTLKKEDKVDELKARFQKLNDIVETANHEVII